MKLRYRVWDGKKMWYHDGVFYIDQDGELFEEDSDGYHFDLTSTNDCIYMLFTNHSDINKREIWEDDIVSVKHADGEVVKCLVFWCASMCSMGMLELDGWDPLTRTGPLRTDAEWEYLGNKWENPELLEE